jgi:hypothetical protein
VAGTRDGPHGQRPPAPTAAALIARPAAIRPAAQMALRAPARCRTSPRQRPELRSARRPRPRVAGASRPGPGVRTRAARRGRARRGGEARRVYALGTGRPDLHSGEANLPSRGSRSRHSSACFVDVESQCTTLRRRGVAADRLRRLPRPGYECRRRTDRRNSVDSGPGQYLSSDTTASCAPTPDGVKSSPADVGAQADPVQQRAEQALAVARGCTIEPVHTTGRRRGCSP